MSVEASASENLDRVVGENLRLYREAAGLSQEEVAAQMVAAGFGFSQATVWKIETGRRPVRLIEAEPLMEAVGAPRWRGLTQPPRETQHLVLIDQVSRRLHQQFNEIYKLAGEYLRGQLDLVMAVHDARAAGVAVPDPQTSWLETTAEHAVLKARVESEEGQAYDDLVFNKVDAILASLRANGYDPVLRPEDVRVMGLDTSESDAE